MSSDATPVISGGWPACGHESPADTPRTDPGLGRCLRPRGHRERADGTGPVLHRDRLHEWEEQPEQPWWTTLGLDSDGSPLT
ncbi:hypothetical protein [Kitasatospora sp. NPDC015120]|uniref:hypothetical protein n=1 Tax=Kitasatospora sp. NPDC015120 TaxID=3364023 RepID=UPI0036F4AD9C